MSELIPIYECPVHGDMLEGTTTVQDRICIQVNYDEGYYGSTDYTAGYARQYEQRTCDLCGRTVAATGRWARVGNYTELQDNYGELPF